MNEHVLCYSHIDSMETYKGNGFVKSIENVYTDFRNKLVLELAFVVLILE